MSKRSGFAALLCLCAAAAGGAPVRILPLGDSITHGYYTGATAFNSYRLTLKSLLDSEGYSTDFTGSLSDGDFTDNQHEGHDGWHADQAGTTNDVLGRVAEWMMDSGADIVLLHIGTNDLLDDRADAAEVSDILDQILAANSQATVVLALIINTDPTHRISSAVSTYNSNLNAMAQARIAAGDDLIVVDMEHGAELVYDSEDMIGIHPSPAGYDKMATNWVPAVTEAIARQWTKHAPRIESIAVSGNRVELQLDNLFAGTPVTIEHSFRLIAADWLPVAVIEPTHVSTGWSEAFSPTNSDIFYRVSGP